MATPYVYLRGQLTVEKVTRVRLPRRIHRHQRQLVLMCCHICRSLLRMQAGQQERGGTHEAAEGDTGDACQHHPQPHPGITTTLGMSPTTGGGAKPSYYTTLPTGHLLNNVCLMLVNAMRSISCGCNPGLGLRRHLFLRNLPWHPTSAVGYWWTLGSRWWNSVTSWAVPRTVLPFALEDFVKRAPSRIMVHLCAASVLSLPICKAVNAVGIGCPFAALGGTLIFTSHLTTLPIAIVDRVHRAPSIIMVLQCTYRICFTFVSPLRGAAWWRLPYARLWW